MEFGNFLIASSQATFLTSCVRLTQDDILRVDLNQAGIVKKLLRKLHRSGLKRSSPGSACTRCRFLKKGCDGDFPCSNCALAGGTCTRHEPSSSARRSPSADDAPHLVLRALQYNPGPPICEDLVTCKGQAADPMLCKTQATHPPKAQATDSMSVTMRPTLGGIGMLLDFGYRAEDIAGMIDSCPPKLRSALDRLSCVLQPMLQNQAAKRRPLPKLDDLFESAQVACTRCEIKPDGSTVFLCNNQAAKQYGAHKKDITARFLNCDMPMVLTEYRLLCHQLDLLYQMCFNESGCFEIFAPFSATCLKAGGQVEERWQVQRWRKILYANGIQATAVLITGEEFDRGVAQRRDALGLFGECTMTGSELFSAQGLFQREQISSIAAEEEGRRMLEKLADKVVAYFRLDAQAQPAPFPAASALFSEGSRL